MSTKHHLNTTAYLSIEADHVHLSLTTMYQSSDDCIQQDNVPCHKALHMIVSSLYSPGLHYPMQNSGTFLSKKESSPVLAMRT